MSLEPHLRLMPEYSAGWPIWSSSGLTDPSSLEVTDDLRAALRKWQDYFEEHFHHERGWDHGGSQRWFDDRGHELLHWLRAELPDIEIELDLWTSPG